MTQLGLVLLNSVKPHLTGHDSHNLIHIAIKFSILCKIQMGPIRFVARANSRIPSAPCYHVSLPATSLKIIGTGACLSWCSISSSFQNSLKTSGHRGYEFLEFKCWNLGPFSPDIGFQLLKSLWSSLTYFTFNDFPNVLYRWKIWTAGRPIEHPDSSTMKPCCCNSCSMWFCIVLLKYTRPSLK